MLTNLQKVGLSIMKNGFFYMCPLPVGWDLEKGLVFEKLTFWRLLFVLMNLGFVVLHLLSCGYVIWAHYLLPERRDVGISTVGLIGCGGSVSALTIILSAYLYAHRSYMPILNVSFGLVDTAIEKFPTRKNEYTLLEKLIVPGPILGILSPWMLLLSGIPNRLDPGYFVVNDTLTYLGHLAYDRTMTHIYGGLIARVLLMLGCFEIARILGFMGATSCVVAYKFRKIMEIAKSSKLTCRQLLLGYRIVLILNGVWSPVVYPALSSTLSFMFWLLLTMWWIAIKKYDDTPLFFYVLIATAVVVLTLGLFLSLTLASKSRETVEMILERCRIITGFRYANANIGSRRWEAKILNKEVTAMRKIGLVYYPFTPMDMEFAIDTMKNLVDRLIDALLIF